MQKVTQNSGLKIEQEAQEMARKYTQKEVEFLDYFRSIDKHAIEVLIHVIEHDIVLTLDIIFQHKHIGKWSDVLSV